MAKVVSPLFTSIKGKLKMLEFRHRKNDVIELSMKRIPAYTRTAAQDQIRTRYGQLVQQWKQLSEAEKQQYEEAARAYAISGWNYYVMVNMAIQPLIFDNANGGDWRRYINIPITSTPSEYAQYKVLISGDNITVYNAEGTIKTTGTGMTDFWNNVKSDGTDIRVFDENQNQLYFFVENFDYTGQSTTIWVKVEANITELNIAYGNPNALKSSYEDYNQVFEFFDDFDDVSLDATKWTTQVNTIIYTLQNSAFYFEDATKSVGDFWIYDGTDTGSQIQSAWTPTGNFIVRWKSKISDLTASEIGQGGIALIAPDNTIIAYLHHSDPDSVQIRPRIDVVGENSLQNVDPNYVVASWGTGTNNLAYLDVQSGDTRTFEIRYDANLNLVMFYVDGNKVAEMTPTSTISKIALAAGAYGGYPYLDYVAVDFVQTLKLADPASFGTPTIITL